MVCLEGGACASAMCSAEQCLAMLETQNSPAWHPVKQRADAAARKMQLAVGLIELVETSSPILQTCPMQATWCNI